MSKKSKKKELQSLVKIFRDLIQLDLNLSDETVSIPGSDCVSCTLSAFSTNIVNEIIVRLSSNFKAYFHNSVGDSLQRYVYSLLCDSEYTDAEIVKELSKKIKWCDDYEKVVFNKDSEEDFITFGDVIHMIESMDSLYGVASSVAMASEEIEASCIAKADEYKANMLELGGGKFEDSFYTYVKQMYEEACDTAEEDRSTQDNDLIMGYDKDADAYTLWVMGEFLCNKDYSSIFRANVLVYGLQL